MGVSSEQPQVSTSYLSREMEKLVTKWVRESIAMAMSRYKKVFVPFLTHLLSNCSTPYAAIQR